MENIEKKDEAMLEKEIANKKRRRTEKIMLAIGITSVVFIVASYAWFIGTTQVSVNEFEIGVKSSEGLTISLDAITFSDNITVSETAVTTDLEEKYPTHKNHWVGEEGLEPVSTVGEFNTNAPTLNIYSKTSITSLSGGYKLRADLIDNVTATTPEDGGSPTYTVNEKDGYVAFDIFVKNSSGSGYAKEYNQGDDEGIYLTNDSKAVLTSTGTDENGQPLTGGDGIENSIRIAFMQVGRVSSSNTGEPAQKIDCNDSDTNTSLCNKGTSTINNNQMGLGVTWNIWEPNDKAHNEDSVQHFARICKKRTAENTYEGTCDPLVDNTYFDTYAANSTIASTDNVNIYDGLNGYENISEKLTKFQYFTDTDKLVSGSTRREIFYLAPNSITKIRVYVFLEGQDVDNYDLGMIGKKIVISFGFTKDKFDTMENIEQVDPDTETEDEITGGEDNTEGTDETPTGEDQTQEPAV